MYAQPKSKVLFYIFFILNLDIKLNIVFDQQLIQAKDADDSLKETILGKDNLLSKIIGATNLLNFAKNSNPIIMFVLVGILLILFTWMTMKLLVPKSAIAFAKHSGESERRISISVVVTSSLIHYFEYFFLLILKLFLSLLVCVTTERQSDLQQES